MAFMDEHQFLYELFDAFLEQFIIKGHSMLDDSRDVFNEDNIAKCIDRFIDDSKEDKRNYYEKIQEQFEGSSDAVKMLFAHANWLWSFSVSDMNYNGKAHSVEICVSDEIEINDEFKELDIFPDEGFGHAGTYHKQNKYWEIVSILRIFKYLQKEKLKKTADIKNRIEEIALYAKYDESTSHTQEWQNDIKEIKKSCAMFNILLYLCNPESYERISSNGHKQKIVDSFSSLLEDDDFKNNDEKIYNIRNNIEKYKSEFDFYDEEIKGLWNTQQSKAEYNEIQGLTFKKNIILYGPPGTSKTYNANSLATSFIYQQIIKNDKTKVKDFIEGKIKIKNRIKKLQLHSNYSYEDFIIGIQLVNGETNPKEGYFLDLCNEIDEDEDKSPYVLILDEINRVDLSRLFGEAFSGIENRESELDLSIKGFKLKVPDNLYIIGTMNEIDFSLERLDFALRRRFVWFFYEFDVDALISMIDEKKRVLKLDKIDENIIDQFIDNASQLNEKITEIEDLGKQYQIGHTFFAELIDIASGFKGRPSYIMGIPIFKEGGPVETLWDISIEPILDAFFGNLGDEQKKDQLEILKKILLNEKK
ncbi:MAG: AAA family ATPase [Spirochaetaceae bacterium]